MTMSRAKRTQTNSTRVVLHVGMPKTGSSFIQSSLALSRNSLSAAGIRYPEHRSDPAAVAGFVTSGNFDASGGRHVRDVVLRDLESSPSSIDSVLYSNEMMSRVLEEDPQSLRDILEVAPVDVVAFVRDPIEWYVSTYGQHVKGKGLTIGVEEFIPLWRPPQIALNFFELCEEMGVGLSVRNYSHSKGNLLKVFAHMVSPQLNIVLANPKRTTVNRSLTLSEEAFQRALNATDFPAPEVLADSLVNQLPDITVEPRPITTELVDLLQKNFSETFARLARFLPAEEAPDFSVYSDLDADSTINRQSDSEKYNFSQRQIEVIVAALASQTTTKPVSAFRAAFASRVRRTAPWR
jgi:hypothetical protein